MAERIKVEVQRGAIERLLNSPGVLGRTQESTQSIADACNAQSSWGGYKYELDTDYKAPVGRVWSYGRSDHPGTDRAMRMVRNLDAGRF